MDKIPAALQHKIDYINALDITARQKAERIATSTADYWAWYYRWQTWERHDEKGLQPAENPPPMPPVMPPKRDIKVNITGINPEGMFTAESIAEAIKEINSIGVQPSTPWPRIQTPSYTLKYIPYESPNDKPIGPANVKFKGEQPSGWYLFGCFLCVSILSASLGAILERTL
jgi:hypothetical protein